MKVHLLGNCQTTVLRKLMQEDHPEWQVSSTELGHPGDHTPEAVARHVTALAKADIVVSQPVTDWKGIPELSLAAVKAMCRPGSALAVFPSMYFEGFHPSFLYLKERLPGFGMPYHNVHAVDMLLRGYRHEEIVALLRSPGFCDADFVHGAFASSMEQLRLREANQAVAVTLSDLLEGWDGPGVPMSTINHPKRPLMARLLNRVYRVLSLPPVAREDGEDHLPDPVIPPLPSVLHHLGLPDADPMFTITGRRYTRDEYTRGSLAYYETVVPEQLLHAFNQSRATAVLAGLNGWKPFPGHGAATGTDHLASKEWLRALFVTFMGRPLPDREVGVHLGGVLEAGTEAWVAALADTPEFLSRFQRRADPAASGPDTSRPWLGPVTRSMARLGS